MANGDKMPDTKFRSLGLGGGRLLARAWSHPLAKNTLWCLSGYALQLAIQAVYFVLIARRLGPAQYGGFISATALASIFAPIIGIGTGSLLVKNVARDPQLFSRYWGNALLVTSASGVALSAMILLLFRVFLSQGTPFVMVACVCLADLVFARLLDVAYWALQAFGNFSVKAQLTVLLSILRLFGIVGLMLISNQTSAICWSVIYFGSSLIVCLAGIVVVLKRHGWPEFRSGMSLDEIVEGFHFSASFSSQSIYNDIDKTMVARLSSLDAAGIYAAAYRLVDTSFLPVRSLLNSAYPEFFRRGTQGLESSRRYAVKLLGVSLPYALGVSAILYGLAPVIPFFLGHSFAGATSALRWLSPLPIFKTFHYFAADSLTGAGYQKQRTIIQGVAAFLNVLLNLWLIPAHGWLGAAWVSLVSDGLLAVLLWLLVFLTAKEGSLPLESETEAVVP